MNQSIAALSKTHKFPQQITPFIGRRQEVVELTQLLADPACRLVTLVGQGGIGKTRLAAAATAGHFEGDIYFVALQAVRDIKALPPAIAAALDLPLTGQKSPTDLICQFLSDQATLLVLDNFEQLLAAANQISILLANLPRLKILVTSREALNLQEEWLFAVPGLSIPPGSQPAESAGQYDAVALFAERARRARHTFSLADEYSDVIDICRLVGGMPLALELAAAWVKTMACRTIAAEIQHNLVFLNTRLRNIPERHRSIQAIFEQSWQMLTAPEQTVYARLSVFRGGFRREAAEQVTGASLTMLTAFVDKSLLHWEPNDRYRLHELLGQYATERLARTPDQLSDSLQAHCTYYTQFVADRVDSLYGGRQLEASAEIDADLDNIRAAWQSAIEYRLLNQLRLTLCPLSLYHQFRARYVDGLEMLQAVVEGVESENPATRDLPAQALVGMAWFYIRLGQIELAQTTSEQAMAHLEALGFPEFPNAHTFDPALTLSLVASIQGDYTQAEQLAQQALRRSHKPGYFFGNRQTANYLLATIAFAQGQIDTARRYAEQAYAAAEQVQDRWFLAYCHHELGSIALASGNYTAAQTYYEAGYTLREAFHDWEGMAVALNHLGKVALHQNNYREAQQRYRRSVEIYQKINDKGGLATAFDGLGQAATGLKAFQTARHSFSQGLSIAAEMGFVPLTLSLLTGVGQLLCCCHHASQAAPLLATAATHPAGLPDTQYRARHWLDVCAVSLDDVPAEPDLQQLIVTAHRELSRLAETLVADAQPTVSTSETFSETVQANQALIEPLTPRELEVLHLIAEGHTNQAIADQLIVTVGTVKAHTNNIYGKLSVSNRTQAVIRARELNLL
ncbi:MAG: tetratricopeptide repeat protein [Anaerolineales bacterium]|nr:tetratricopeptide repeat protein [Anaerolineales bacterium]